VRSESVLLDTQQHVQTIIHSHDHGTKSNIPWQHFDGPKLSKQSVSMITWTAIIATISNSQAEVQGAGAGVISPSLQGNPDTSISPDQTAT
jgi:hypothetical protein